MERIRSFWVIRDEDEEPEEATSPVPNEADTAERITTPTDGMTTRDTTDGEIAAVTVKIAAVTVTDEDSRNEKDDESSQEDDACAQPSALEAQRRRSTTPQNSGGPNVAKLAPLGGGLVGHAHIIVPAMEKSQSVGSVSPRSHAASPQDRLGTASPQDGSATVNFRFTMAKAAVPVPGLSASSVNPRTRRFFRLPAFKLEPRKHLHILLSLREHIFMRFVSGHTDHTRQSEPEQNRKNSPLPPYALTAVCACCLPPALRSSRRRASC